jgi:glucose/arabinose dehydrogenase
VRKKKSVLLWLVAGVSTVGVVLLALMWFGPVTIGDKKLLLDFVLGRGIAPPSASQISNQLRVVDGFELSVYSSDVPLARWPLATEAGDLVISRTRADAVVLLERDADRDGRPDGARPLLDDLDGPHGLALHEGWLYVAERTAIGRTRFDVSTGRSSGSYEHIVTGLTADGFHQTKTIGFGPDGWLYLSQGSTCNVCIEDDERRATVMRMLPDGSRLEVFATGLRNSVGFDWAPWDGALYATENGRDLLGDDTPPDELNRIEQGGFYGWPFVHGAGIRDPDFGQGHDAEIRRAIAPAHAFRPHNAPLGIRFLRGANPPAGYERTALVALHGSWNRRTLDGYKVVALDWQPDGRIVERDFVTGFLGPDGIIGRPAGVTQGPGGDIFITDDYAGVVYRVARAPNVTP